MEGKVQNFYHLEAWKKGHSLALEIYKITKKFPRDELFGMVSQLRRASSSITANIAEGFARYHFKDKIRFYYQARGSAAEVHNFLLLAHDLGYIDGITLNKLVALCCEIQRLINGMIRSIERQHLS